MQPRIGIFAVIFYGLLVSPEYNCRASISNNRNIPLSRIPEDIIREGKRFGFDLQQDFLIGKPLFLWNTRHEKEQNRNSNEIWTPSLQDKFCGEYRCSGRNTSAIPSAHNDRRLHEACYCDTRCSDYQDCCYDSPYRDLQKEQNPLPYVRVEVPPEALGVPNSQYVRFTHICPPAYKNVEVINKCAKAMNFENGKLEDAEYITLVTNTRTRMTYANKYCAECNKEINWKSWTLRIKYAVRSTREVEFLKNVNPNNFRFDNNRSTWYFIHDGVSYDCDTQIEPAVPMKYDYARISVCPASWSDPVVRRKCENGVYYKLGAMHPGCIRYHNIFFKNKHCALCNGVRESMLTCDRCFSPFAAGDGNRVFLYIFVSRFSKDDHADDITKPNHGRKLSVSETPLEKNWFFTTYVSVAMLISLFFLICNLIISSLTQQLETIVGKIMASFSSALILAYGSFIAGNFLTNHWDIISCQVTAVITYYSFLNVFSCMLCVLYGVQKNISNGLKSLKPSYSKHFFIKHLAYSWGTPVVPVFLSIVLNYIYPDSSFAPNFGGQACWFQHNNSLHIFFILPVSVVCAINFLFFLNILHKMRNYKKKISDQIQSTIDVTKVCLRVAVLTGVTWITGLAANYTQHTLCCILFQLFNTMHGLFIFIAFSCEKSVLLKLLKRLGLFQSWQTALEKSMIKQNCNIELEIVNKKSKLPQITSPGWSG